MTQYLIDITTKQGADYLAHRWVGARHATLPPFEKESLNRDSINAFLQNLGKKFKELSPPAQYALIGSLGGGGVGLAGGLLRKDKKNWWRDMLTGALAGGGAGAGIGLAQQAWEGRGSKKTELDPEGAAAQVLTQYQREPTLEAWNFPTRIRNRVEAKEFNDQLLALRGDNIDLPTVLNGIQEKNPAAMHQLALDLKKLQEEGNSAGLQLAQSIAQEVITAPYNVPAGVADLFFPNTPLLSDAAGLAGVGLTGWPAALTGREAWLAGRGRKAGPGRTSSISPERLRAIFGESTAGKGLDAKGKVQKGHAGVDDALLRLKEQLKWDNPIHTGTSTGGKPVSFGGAEFPAQALRRNPHMVYEAIVKAMENNPAAQQRLYVELHNNPDGPIAKKFNTMLQQIRTLETPVGEGKPGLTLNVADPNLSHTYARSQRADLAGQSVDPKTKRRINTEVGAPGARTRAKGDWSQKVPHLPKGLGRYAALLGLGGGGVASYYKHKSDASLQDAGFDTIMKPFGEGGFNFKDYILPSE